MEILGIEFNPAFVILFVFFMVGLLAQAWSEGKTKIED